MISPSHAAFLYQKQKPILSILKEWAIATWDITPVTQLPFKRPAVLRPILSNSLPLPIISVSVLESYQRSNSLPAMCEYLMPCFYYSKWGIFVKQWLGMAMDDIKREINTRALPMILRQMTNENRFWDFWSQDFARVAKWWFEARSCPEALSPQDGTIKIGSLPWHPRFLDQKQKPIPSIWKNGFSGR